MMDAVPELSNYITHYASHFIHANVQFSGIETIVQSMKIDTSIVYMVTNHKKNILR